MESGRGYMGEVFMDAHNILSCFISYHFTLEDQIYWISRPNGIIWDECVLSRQKLITSEVENNRSELWSKSHPMTDCQLFQKRQNLNKTLIWWNSLFKTVLSKDHRVISWGSRSKNTEKNQDKSLSFLVLWISGTPKSLHFYTTMTWTNTRGIAGRHGRSRAALQPQWARTGPNLSAPIKSIKHAELKWKINPKESDLKIQKTLFLINKIL